VLQEHAVRPVGSVVEEPVDVRVIASSNRDPEAALRSGVLRADLYYRLRGSTLVMPSLDTRREDIPDLVEHHLSVLNRRYGGPGAKVRGITARALRALSSVPWPGNVRELQYVVERPPCAGRSSDGEPDFASSAPERGRPIQRPAAHIHENERTLIERVLRVTRRRGRAARDSASGKARREMALRADCRVPHAAGAEVSSLEARKWSRRGDRHTALTLTV
jgi:transcriptional regulator with PAS, ATPase and Fis domain